MSEKRDVYRAAVEAGYASLAGYVEKYKSDGTAVPADTHQAELQAALARAEAAEANLNSGRELLREAWSQLNAIRAWRGAPPGVSEDWFSKFIDDLGGLLKDECLPWMTAAAKALVATYQRQIEQAQDRAIEAERQRDEAWTAGAEAMRGVCVDALESHEKFVAAALLVCALPIPTQEK